MANYTSTQSGSWVSDATWGGGGKPTGTGDTATIANGHTVTLTTNLTNVIGNVTINTGGILVHGAGDGNGQADSGNGIMKTSGKVLVNGTLHQKSGSRILFSGSASNQRGLYIENNTNAHWIAEGSDGMLTTKTNGALNINDTAIVVDSSTGFAVGEWIAIYALDNTGTEGDYDGSRYEDEGVWIHDINGTSIYFRHFVGPDDVTLTATAASSATSITVSNAKVFRVNEYIIFGTGSNRNVCRIKAINYSSNVIDLMNLANTNDYAVAGSNASGTYVYKTGLEKPHRDNSRVRKVATVTTVAKTSTDDTITLAQDEKFEAGDVISIECVLQTAGNTSNRDWNSYETRHIVQSRSSNTLTLTADIGYNVPVGAIVTRLTRDCVVGTVNSGSTDIENSTNHGWVYIERYTSNYNRTLFLKDVWFKNLGTNTSSNVYGGVTIRGHFSTNDMPITPVTSSSDYQSMSTEGWIEGCTTMLNRNTSLRDYSGMWLYDYRNGTARCCVTTRGRDGFTIHWDPGMRIYNCIAIANEYRGLRLNGTHYQHETAYNYINRAGDRAIYIDPTYNPGRGIHDIIVNVADKDALRINRHTGYTGSMWKIDVKDALYEGPYMSEVGHGDFVCFNSRFRAIDSANPGNHRTSGSAYAGRQGYSSGSAIFRVFEADFEYDKVINYTYYMRFIWDADEGAYLVQRTFHDDGERAALREFIHVPPNTTLRVRISCKPVSGFSGTEPYAYVATAHGILADWSTDANDPWTGTANEGLSMVSPHTEGVQFASFESNTGWQDKDLTVPAVPFSRFIQAGVNTHDTDAAEGFYLKPIKVWLDNMPVHRDMMLGNSSETNLTVARYGTSHGALQRRWGGIN
tara:strand:- start:43 stop:2616 length:2574 start_codon:yes stop_codon:yes gene_type:complete